MNGLVQVEYSKIEDFSIRISDLICCVPSTESWFFFFLTHTLLAGQAVFIQLPSKLKMNNLSHLLYFFSSERFHGSSQHLCKLLPAALALRAPPSSKKIKIFLVRSLFCARLPWGNLAYEHSARFFCSKRANEPLETTLWVTIQFYKTHFNFNHLSTHAATASNRPENRSLNRRCRISP